MIWLNDDAEVQPRYAREAITFMEAHPQIGLGALYYSENGCPYHNSLTLRVLLAGHGVAGIAGAHVIHHSEQDQIRMENQAYRLRDNDTLNRKYLTPYVKSCWQATYNRFRLPGDAIAWSHGRRPVGVRG